MFIAAPGVSMEARSAPSQARYPPFLKSSLHAPSVPIPIPARRITTNPPPRSPDRRNQPMSDLLFDMSPLSPCDSPLKQHSFFRAHDSEDVCQNVRPRPERPLEQKNDSYVAAPLCSHEPFLYSIPRLPLRSNILHHRSRSEFVNSQLMKNSISPDFVPTGRITPSSISNTSFSPSTSASESLSIHRRNESNSQNVLTSAFQVSVSSDSCTTVSSGTGSPPECDANVHRHLSPPETIRTHNPVTCCPHVGIKRRKADYLASLRTSAAAPVISLAQAELSSQTGVERSTRASKGKPRSPPYATTPPCPRSPYAFPRGRRNSVLRERGLRFSDEELNGTPKREYRQEKFGLEKYVPTTHSKHAVCNENVTKKSDAREMERGRSRTKGKAGTRA